MTKQQIIVPRDGIATGDNKVRAIYSPLTAALLGAMGETDMRRASHVEPGSELKFDALKWLRTHNTQQYTEWHAGGDPSLNMLPQYKTKWWADLLPVDGPVLGPFDTNTEALEAEVVWLKEHNIPICGPCRDAAVAEIEGRTDEHNNAE